MFLADYLPLLLLGAAVAVTALFVIPPVRSLLQPNRAKSEIWSKVDSLTVTSSGGILSWTRAIPTSVLSTRKFATEGYTKFSKGLKRPFAIPTTWTGGWFGGALVVLPPSLFHKMMTRPDKQPDSEITNIFGLIETIQLSYLINDPDIYMNPLHFDVVRRKMTRKDMDPFAADTAEEVDLAFREIWGISKEWKTVNSWDMCSEIIARVAERMMVGLPMGRDHGLLEASNKYASSALLGGALMNCFPPIIRQVVGRVIALPARYYQRRCVRILAPVIEERIRIYRSQGEAGEGVPDDFLQWLVATCAKDGEHQLHAARIAYRLTALMTPLIFAVCYMFSHAVLDLYGSPSKDEFLAGLEAECKGVSARFDGLTTADAVDALHRVDSTIRESMRVSDVSVVNLHRDVTSGQVDIGNGVYIKPGVRMTFPTQNIHNDPDNFAEPRRFDAFRFSRQFEGENSKTASLEQRETLATPTLNWLAFGYGRHACPGRWYAANTMKQTLAYIIMNYDLELVGEPIKRKAMLNTMVPPVHAQMRIRRKS